MGKRKVLANIKVLHICNRPLLGEGAFIVTQTAQPG